MRSTLLCVVIISLLAGQAGATPQPAEIPPAVASKPESPSSPRDAIRPSTTGDELAPTLREAKKLLGEKDYKGALRLFQKASKMEPRNADIFNNIGLCYYYCDDIDKAIEMFRKAAALDPGMSSVYYNLGLCYTSRKQWDLAAIELNKAVGDNPKNARAHFDLGSVYFVKKDLAKAKKHYEKAATLYGYDTPQGEQALRNAIKMEMLMERRGR